ncbi:hypothetical protein [Pseudophaeobacter sp.]|uniref:hypothetical protein n=1 Tax=Pseudophaeobacter sp. TaxID=1971739 RepID=UPI003298F73F
MTVHFDFLSPPGVMMIVYEGRSTEAQQNQLFQEMVEVFGVGPFVDSISDMSALTSSSITGTDMYLQSVVIKKQVEKLPQPIRQALYAPGALPYGIARMYMGYADLSPKLDNQIFDDLQAAIDWMGLQGTVDSLFGQRQWRSIAD